MVKIITVDWKQQISPGFCFMQIAAQDPVLTAFGRIIERSQENVFLCHTFSMIVPTGEYLDLHVKELAMLLSLEQFALAKRLNWPSDEEDLIKILKVPSN